MSDDLYDDFGLPTIDERDRERITPALLRRIDAQMAASAKDRVKIAQKVHQEVARGIAKGGALVAYRERVRSQALNAFFAIAGADVTDTKQMLGIQIAIARYIDVEHFIAEQVGLHEGRDEPEGPSSGDDSLYGDEGDGDGASGAEDGD